MGRPSFDQEGRARLRVLGQQLDGMGPETRGDLHHRKAVLRVPDRRRQIGRERQLSEPLVERRPARHRSRNRDGVHATIRQLTRDSLAPEELDRHSGRRPPAGVHSVQAVFFRDVDDREEIAADPVGGRLHQALRRVRGDRRVHGAAASLQDLHRRLRGEGLAGRRDAVLRRGHRAAGNGKSRGERERQGHHGGLLSLRGEVLYARMPKGKPREQGDTAVVTEKKTRTQKPKLWKVLLHNDDYTTMEFVIHVLEVVFNRQAAEAHELMLQVHTRGMCVAGVYTYEIAETKVATVEQMARAAEYPFLCTMEPE